MLDIDKNIFVSLNATANHFNLPVSYLKNLADTGAIPFLIVNGRCRFNLMAVETALMNLATAETRSLKNNNQRRQSATG
jgi:hypothetical protein